MIQIRKWWMLNRDWNIKRIYHRRIFFQFSPCRTSLRIRFSCAKLITIDRSFYTEKKRYIICLVGHAAPGDFSLSARLENRFMFTFWRSICLTKYFPRLSKHFVAVYIRRLYCRTKFYLFFATSKWSHIQYIFACWT